MIKIITLIFSLSFMLTGCDKKVSNEIGYGDIKAGLYQNNYFNMSIQLPESWVVQSQAAQEKMMQKGVKLISQGDENSEKMLEEINKQTLNLFSVFKFEQGTPVAFNPSIIAVAERVADKPGVKRGSDYHYHVKRFLEGSPLKYKFPKKIYSEELSGVSFDVMPATITGVGVMVQQDYYATRTKDYMLSFILSYSTEAEKKQLVKIIGTLAFQ